MISRTALILDFGGVVTRTLFETHELTERALGLSPGSLTWQGPFAPESDDLWMAMQNDEISEREYWAQRTSEVGGLLGEHWTEMSQFVMAARGADPESVIRPEALPVIDIAKAGGAKLAILSNELDLFYGRQFRRKLPFLQKFDVIADATHTKVLKPNARAYLDCATELGVKPRHCIFVDDQTRNVQGAQAVGMNAVHFDVRRPGKSFEHALSLLAALPEVLEHA
jgi:putative hydrolase of the HAD superfamily